LFQDTPTVHAAAAAELAGADGVAAVDGGATEAALGDAVAALEQAANTIAVVAINPAIRRWIMFCSPPPVACFSRIVSLYAL
jgi:hypothetical protein